MRQKGYSETIPRNYQFAVRCVLSVLIRDRTFDIRCWTFILDEPVKSPISDGFVKSAEIKACEPRGMRRTYGYSAVTRDEAKRRYRTFYGSIIL